MKKNIIARSLLTAMMMTALATPAAKAQSAFFQAVANLHPVAYWPLQETAQPPSADVEINLGSLGAAGNAFYSSTNVYKGQLGSPADGSDAYVVCDGKSGGFLAVPTTDPRTTVPVGPFTVEAWVNPAGTGNYVGMVSQSGANPGGLNGSTYRGGWVLSQNYLAYIDNNNMRGWSFHVYNGQGAGNGQPQGGAEAGIPYNYAIGTWYYLAAVFDGTNCTLYLNGTNINSGNAGYEIPMTGSYVPDTWDPLTIGCGRGMNANLYNGGVDEVAIYTNALTAGQVQAHYNAASVSYAATINSDKPYLWWRMDAPDYASPDVGAYPLAATAGSDDSLNGLYLSGTTPGVAGPAYSGLGSPSYACAFNGIGTDNTNGIPVYTNGVLNATNLANTGILITNLPNLMNPNNQDTLLSNANFSLTALCWFKANPANSRYEGLLGAGDRSWKLSLNSNGHLRWFPGVTNIGDFESSGNYNDGNWHFVAGVLQNSDVAAAPSGVIATNSIYVDGVLDRSEVITNEGSGGNSIGVLLGGAPDYSLSGYNNNYNQRYFSGSLAHAAYFTNALNADQIVNLYTNAGATMPAPTITAQPYPYPSIRSVVANPGTYIYEAVVAYGGTPALGYQWYYNSGSNYVGATALSDGDGTHYINSQTSQVTVTNLTSGDSGYYFCVVNNDYGATTSAIVNVQVYDAPVITAQSPSGPFTLFTGQSPSLSVSAMGATNLIYQWFTNGVADASGTNANYSLPGAQAQSAETFQCIVTNTHGSATSEVATLTLQPLPGNVASSGYATNLLALNPTVYFPMHETSPAAAADMETNYGTLGAAGTAYYADWNVNNGNPDNIWFIHQFSSALPNDSDGSLSLLGPNAGNAVSHLLVPHASPLTTLTPPFTIEFWVYPNNANFGDILSQDGTWLNGGNTTHQNTDGIRVVWNRSNIQLYGNATINTTGTTLSLNQWYYIVLTYDGTNMIYYVNGSQAVSGQTTAFVPDYWDPLLIGAGFWKNSGGANYNIPMGLDEVAVYNTNLDANTISTHYNDGLYGASGQYYADVTTAKPVLYYRMDAPTYTAPPMSEWPVMTNYGTAAVNGVYTPGSAPGSAAGPNNGAGLTSSTLSGNNALPCNGLSTFAEAYDPAAFDPAGGTTPFTVSMWFKGNPSDASRYQCLTSEGTGWQINQAQNGTLQFYLSTAFNSRGVYNDGIWHQVVVTYSTNVLTMYVDGLLDNIATNSAYTNPPPDTADYTGFGADTRYVNGNGGSGRQYAGDICEFAFWNGTALTAGQVTTLYQASGMAPIISTQPASASVNARTAFTNSVAAFGPGPLTYQWYRDGQPLPIGGQTNLTIGATNASLIFNPVKTNDASADYYVVVANQYGATTSSVVSLTVYGPPAFVSEPIDFTQTNNILLFAGASPTFQVGTIGAQRVYYQWFTNGVAATANDPALTNYTLPTLQLNGVTNFFCVASNFVDKATNTPISITVLADPTAPYPLQVLMNNPIGYWRLNEPDNGLNDYNAGVIADDYWGGNNGIYTNTILGQPGYANASGTDPNTTAAQFGFSSSFVNNDAYGIGGVDFATPTNSNAAFSVEAWVNGYPQTKDAGIVSKGYGGGGEEFALDTGSTAAGSGTHSFRFYVRDASGTAHNANSSIQLDNQWHHLVGVCDETNGTLTLYVDGVAAGSATIAPGSGLLSSDRAMLIGSRPSSATSANDYQFVGSINDVAVYNYALSAAQVGTQYAAAGVAPNISQAPPASATADGYGVLTIPAAAVGTPNLGYQWYDVNGGTNVAAFATNGPLLDATLSVTNVPLTWNGDTLELTVTNAFGSTNIFVTLTVYTNAPQFTVDLPPQVIEASGKTYTYSVSVVGPKPYSYQWYNGATAIDGATNSTYSLVAGAPGSTTYSVTVSNVFGATNSTVSTFTSVAPPGGYPFVANVLALNPVGYWPLQETNAPAPATLETNYGSLGALGTAYYAGTNAAAAATGGNVSFGQGGALTASGDNDTAAGFLGGNNNSYLFVPLKAPALEMNGPFTWECWVNSTSTGFSDILGSGGAPGDGSGTWGGIRLSYNRSTSMQAYWYYGSGSNFYSDDSGSGTITPGVWNYVVMTYDGTNVSIYINGTNDVTSAATIAPNYSVPFTVGTGRWDGGPTRSYSGLMDEVAVYTNVLTPDRIKAHYLAGTTITSSNYVSAVQADNPLLYYRMDGVFTAPDPTTYPIAVNYGSSPVNGNYESGIVPGEVSGPTNSVLGTNALAASINGVFSCVDAGYDPAFNPTGTQPFTAMTWFKGNPADNRVQTIMGQGQNWAMNLVGTNGGVVWNLYSGGHVASATVLNDGNWHFVAGVYDGANSYLYVDGALDNSGPATVGLTGEPNASMFLGGDADYTFDQYQWASRYFAGALAQAAFFTNALTATQIQTLYVGSVTPMISLGHSGINLVITYTGALLSSPNVAGPYAPVAGAPFAASPATYTVTPTGAQVFYRTSSQ